MAPMTPATDPDPIVRHRGHVLAGSGLGGAMGAAIGAAAGGMLGGPLGVAVGAVVGLVLGAAAGAVAGHAAAHGADHRFAGDPQALIGYVIVDRTGAHLGKVVSVYLADREPWYLGVATTWIPAGDVHLLPVVATRAAEHGRKLEMQLEGEALRQSPTIPIAGRIDRVIEDAIWEHYEPLGIPAPPVPAADLPPAAPAGVGGPLPQGGEVAFSGDAPYRVAEQAPLQPFTGAAPLPRAEGVGRPSERPQAQPR